MMLVKAEIQYKSKASELSTNLLKNHHGLRALGCHRQP